MKKYKKSLFIFILIGFMLLTSLPNVKGFDDIEYTFERDILYDESEPELDFFNMREQQVYNGSYNATYSFENEVGLSGTDISFIDSDASGVSATNTIISSKLSHSEVLEMNRTITDSTSIINNFNNSIISGSVELWFYMISSNNELGIFLLNASQFPTITLRIETGLLQEFSGGSHNTLTTINSNLWYHLRLDFDCTLDTYDIYLNGILLNSSLPFREIDTSLDFLRFFNADSLEYTNYIDAIAYSWDFDSDSAFTTEIDLEILAGWGTYLSGAISDTYTINSNYYMISSEEDEGNGLIFFEMIFNISIVGLFSCLITTNETMSQFQLRDDDNPIANGDGTNTLSITNLNVAPTTFLKIRTESGLPDYTMSIDYIELKTNVSINYVINDNLFPILETLEGFEGLYETDKYEFSLLDVNERAILGATSFGLWSFTAVGSASTTITTDGNIDRKISLGLAGAGNCTIKRTSLSITEKLVDVNFGFSIIDGLSSNNANFTVLLRASDQSIITGYRIEQATNSLFYFDGIWNLLRNDLALDGSDFFDINLGLHYDIDLVKLEYIKDDVFIENHFFEMVSTGKTGLFEIEGVFFKSGGGTGVARVDYVGLYRNGESWHGELGLMTTPIGKGYHFERHNIYSSLGNGRFHEGVIEGSYIVGQTPFLNIRNISTISGVAREGVLNTTNTYEFFYTNITNATLIFTCVGSDISISDITIEGSKLTEGSNEYFLIYTSGGLESKDNYFYVDDSNNLRFIHNTGLQDVNEFIQAEFDIDDKTSTDTAVSFRSDIDVNAFGFFRLKYDTTSQIIPIENILKSKRILLTTAQTIGSFIILVSDTNKNGISGLTEGLVSDIVLLDINTAIVSIVSLNIVEMIIPLIIILIPTLAISGLYGKFLVAPLFLMFSLLVAITSIIPIWLFFVIAMSNIILIFFDNTKKEVM